MSRIPIRIRLTLAFVLALGIVLAGLGWIVYTRFEKSLDDNADRALRSRATDITAVIERSGPRLSSPGADRFIESDESFAQLLDSDGRVVDGSRLVRLARPPDRRRDAPGTGRIAHAIARRCDRDGRSRAPVRGARRGSRAGRRPGHRGRRGGAGDAAAAAWASACQSHCCWHRSRATPSQPRRSGLSRRCAERRRGVSEDRPGEQPAVAARGRRDQAARRDTQRDARPARGRARARAGVRRGRQPRAAHAAGEPEDRARACAAARPHDGRAPARAAVGIRGDGPAQPPGGRPARAGALGPRNALAPDRAGAGEGAARRRRRAVPDIGTRRARGRARRTRAPGRSPAPRTGGREPRRERRERTATGPSPCPRGGATGRSSCTSRTRARGFRPASQTRAFERFTRADEARGSGGAGLGLAIVAAVARAHGGRAGFSPRERGTDAWIAIPALTEYSSGAATKA